MKILVLNSGSSSLKYQLFDMDKHLVIAKGRAECISEENGLIIHKVPMRDDYRFNLDMESHDKALEEVFKLLVDKKYGVLNSINEIDAIGHRVAHGGEKYKVSSIVDQEMIDYLESIVPINPLHGPAAIKGIKASKKLLPNVKQVCVFDTSFYANMKEENYIYPLPYEFYENDKVRKYGFHGTSHRYVALKASEMLKKPLSELKLITCHLGNGASITAIDRGIAIDTSMGFTPQEGLVMGTRSGDIDPTIIPYLMKTKGYSPDEMDEILNKKSGLRGISGVTNDMRALHEEVLKGDKRCALAALMFDLKIKKYIGAYIAELNGCDAIVFTAGIGENRSEVREKALENLEYLGIKIDKELNDNLKRGEAKDISSKNSKVRVLVIPTDEEYMIALDTLNLIK